MCGHLQACREPWLHYVQWLVGAGLDVHLLCGECEPKEHGGSAARVARVCEECYEYATEEVGECVGIKGKPEVRSRPGPFDVEIRETEVPAELGAIVDVAPVEGQPAVWLLLGEDGGITRIDLGTGAIQKVAISTLGAETDHKPWCGRSVRRRLHASACGRFVGVVHDYGTKGQLIDLSSGVSSGLPDGYPDGPSGGRVTADLSGGEYHNNTVPFSFAFVEIDGRVAALHRTDWNRLDLTDAATGECLTARKEPENEGGEDQDAELDYFFGGLHLNPSRTHVAVDGWVWHPVGVVMTGSVSAWIGAGQEPGAHPKTRAVCDRAYHWDGPMVWLDDDTFIVGGIGDDDERMMDGARVFRLPNPAAKGAPAEIATFAGPSGTFFSDGSALFASDSTGLSRWDPTDGCQTGFIAGFSPTHRHSVSCDLLQLASPRLLRWGRVGA